MDLTSLSCSYIFNEKNCNSNIDVYMYLRVATGQEMGLEKILQGHGEAMEVYLESGKIDVLTQSQ